MEQASALNVQLALGYIERDQLGIAQEKLEKAIEQNPKKYRCLYLDGLSQATGQ
jgi:Tfp pilus assembly protein PilF